jgi:hypothetical protein
MTQYTLFIDGRRVQAASGRRYDSVDPYLGQPWASAADGDAADVDAAVSHGPFSINILTERTGAISPASCCYGRRG